MLQTNKGFCNLSYFSNCFLSQLTLINASIHRCNPKRAHKSMRFNLRWLCVVFFIITQFDRHATLAGLLPVISDYKQITKDKDHLLFCWWHNNTHIAIVGTTGSTPKGGSPKSSRANSPPASPRSSRSSPLRVARFLRSVRRSTQFSNHSASAVDSAPSFNSDDGHSYPDADQIEHLRLSRSSVILTEAEIEPVLPDKEEESWTEMESNLNGKLKVPILEAINSPNFPPECHHQIHLRLIAARKRVWICWLFCLMHRE